MICNLASPQLQIFALRIASSTKKATLHTLPRKFASSQKFVLRESFRKQIKFCRAEYCKKVCSLPNVWCANAKKIFARLRFNTSKTRQHKSCFAAQIISRELMISLNSKLRAQDLCASPAKSVGARRKTSRENS